MKIFSICIKSEGLSNKRKIILSVNQINGLLQYPSTQVKTIAVIRLIPDDRLIFFFTVQWLYVSEFQIV